MNADEMIFLFKNRDKIMKVLLSERQEQIVRFICKNGPTTSADLAARFGISLQSSSAQLKHLYIVGWLDRGDIGDPTGGKLFVYTSKYSVI